MAVRERFIDQINENEHLVQVKWRAGAERIFDESYDSIVHLNDDEDDNCFYCPNCMEPIYEEEFDELESTTWLLVTIYPSSLIIIPEPLAVASDFVGIPNPKYEFDVAV